MSIRKEIQTALDARARFEKQTPEEARTAMLRWMTEDLEHVIHSGLWSNTDPNVDQETRNQRAIDGLQDIVRAQGRLILFLTMERKP